MSQEYSYQDVAEHNTKKDVFMVIHDKVYDATKFIDEHPYAVPFPHPQYLPFGEKEERHADSGACAAVVRR
jgi:hypothetical protein